MSFPVKVNNDFLQKIIIEGTYANITLRSGALVSPASGSATVGSANMLPTEMFYIVSATPSITNGYSGFQFIHSSGPNNGTIEQRWQLPSGGSSLSIPMNQVIYPNTTYSAGLLGGDGATVINGSSINLAGYVFSADMNFNANKVMLWIGDSVSRGSSINPTVYNGSNWATASSPLSHYIWQVRNHFQTRGIDCRVVNKSMGGYTSISTGYWLNQGWLDIEQVDIIFYQMGINDTTAPTSSGNFTTELQRIISLRDRKYPTAKIVFVGATPLNNNTTEATLATFRTLMSNEASAPDNIYYVSLATAFDRTVLANYTSSDGVHPNIASNALCGTVLTDWITTNNITF